MRERWYPLTDSGYYAEDLTVTASTEWECCAEDISPYRGCVIGLQAVGRCALTDGTGAVLQRWETIPQQLTVPESAGRLYISNRHTENPDFYITVPADRVKKPNGLLFYRDFTGPAAPDGTALPVGIENALVIHRSTALDNWTFTAEITAVDHTEEIFFGSRITQPGSQQDAGQRAENIAQMERGGAADIDGNHDAGSGSNTGQGCHQGGKYDFTGGDFAVHRKSS